MSEASSFTTPAAAPLPEFAVRLDAPDLRPWIAGNTGIPGFTSFDSGIAGPHVAAVALIHGNELAGAIALDRLLRAELRPLRGRLTFGFANLAAFERFDPRQPTASRFIDEDLNRLWHAEILDGRRASYELERARAIRPLIEGVDVLLDLHSMLWPSEPLILCGPTHRGGMLAAAVGTPSLIVADHGHVGGPRLIDFAPFVDPERSSVAILVEAGQHWEPETVDVSLASLRGLLRHTGLARVEAPAAPRSPCRFAQVTAVVTATTSAFVFLQPFRGGEVIRERNTLIALDGPNEIRTPHDDCLLVMPSLRPSRGHTALRMARFV